VPDVPEAEVDAAAAVLEYIEEEWDTRDAAQLVLEAAAWVRAHPDQASEAPAMVLAAAGLERRVVWAPLVADAAATAVAVWGIASGRLPELLDSTRWPHLMWLLAGAVALALLTSDVQDIHRCYRTIRHTRQARRTRQAGQAGGARRALPAATDRVDTPKEGA
jgi:hypothetical protein